MLGSVCMETGNGEPHITYSLLEGNGRTHFDPSTLTIDWDSDENMANVRSAVALIKKGCGRKMGCISARYKCKKGGVLAVNV